MAGTGSRISWADVRALYDSLNTAQARFSVSRTTAPDNTGRRSNASDINNIKNEIENLRNVSYVGTNANFSDFTAPRVSELTKYIPLDQIRSKLETVNGICAYNGANYTSNNSYNGSDYGSCYGYNGSNYSSNYTLRSSDYGSCYGNKSSNYSGNYGAKSSDYSSNYGNKSSNYSGNNGDKSSNYSSNYTYYTANRSSNYSSNNGNRSSNYTSNYGYNISANATYGANSANKSGAGRVRS